MPVDIITSVDRLADRYDLVVVGAGPAGLSAGARAADHGVRVLLVDENPAPGGQIYRAVSTTPVRDRNVLGPDYWHGAEIVARFDRAQATYAPESTLWSIEPREGEPAGSSFEVGLSLEGRARVIVASQLILATGAQERPFPIPGWTKPGVMTAGSAQIALKSAGIIPAGPTVIAGCGPLIYLLASQLAAAGTNIVAVLDTTVRSNWADAARALPGFLLSPYLVKGLKLMAKVRSRLRFVAGVTGLEVEGEVSVTAVRAERGGVSKTIACETLLLHQGVIPSVNLASATGCSLHFDEMQHCWTPRVDDWFESSRAGIAIAGDGAGIAGAEAAALRGEIAALGAVQRLGQIDTVTRDREAAPLRGRLRRALRGRRFLDILYRPAAQFLAPPNDETIVCRCEEVRAGQVRNVVKNLGVTGPNQLKTFLRCGMGPCQGRLCGPTVVDLIAETTGATPATVGYYRLRPPVKPVTLAEMANLPRTESAVKAVMR